MESITDARNAMAIAINRYYRALAEEKGQDYARTMLVDHEDYLTNNLHLADNEYKKLLALIYEGFEEVLD